METGWLAAIIMAGILMILATFISIYAIRKVGDVERKIDLLVYRKSDKPSDDHEKNKDDDGRGGMTT